MAHGRMVLRIVATLAAVSLIAACGFKGPLYLPPAPGESEPKPPEPLNIPPVEPIP